MSSLIRVFIQIEDRDAEDMVNLYNQNFKELGVRDKITLAGGRFLLGNKYAHTFVFFYSIGRHLLV